VSGPNKKVTRLTKGVGTVKGEKGGVRESGVKGVEMDANNEAEDAAGNTEWGSARFTGSLNV